MVSKNCLSLGPWPRERLYQVLLVLSFCLAESAAINSVLDINGTFPYLMDRNNKTIEPRDYMDFDNIYTPNETYRLKQTIQGRNYHLLKAFDFASYYRSDYWHYSDHNDLLLSAQPVANPDKCALHLDWLEQQLNRSHNVLFQPGEQHMNLMTVFDSFGHPETATYFGHGYWLGSYHECQRASLNLDIFQYEDCMRENNYDATKCGQYVDKTSSKSYNQTLKFRYCIGKAHDSDWPANDNYVPKISYKVGLCLPETCETLSFEKHASQIERLMKLNLPDYHRNRIVLREIYCLPDERSPIRQLPSSARTFLTLCFAWLGMLMFATCVFSCYQRHQKDLRDILLSGGQRDDHHETQCQSDSSPGALLMTLNGTEAKHPLLSNGVNGVRISPSAPEVVLYVKTGSSHLFANNTDAKQTLIGVSSAPSSPPINLDISSSTGISSLPNIFKDPHISTSNLSNRSNSSSRSYLSAWIAESPAIFKFLRALSIKETLSEFMRPPKLLDAPGADRKLRVNLNALDAIKCLCCILVIFGHIIFIHMQHLSNIIHTIELSYEIYPRALIAFFNFVDTFFIISGMLTAYFIFKRFNAKTFSRPIVWLTIILLRLLRLSPVYILVFWFIKTTSVHLTHGPIWDYGTDKNSIKGLCINDHWWKSILYFGNVGTMQPLCILPAWSIIVDSQYSLVIPFIIYAIFKSQRVGYFLLFAATIISTAKMTMQLANQTAVNTSDMSKIRLHVYPLISRFAAEFYNTAWNRIGPVAIGILGGHMLYLYEIKKIRRWPAWMYGYGFKLVLILHLFIFLLPTIGRLMDDPQSTTETDITIFILSNAAIKPIWSVINTIFLLRLITDLRSSSVLARLMSHNIWHCLGKLCFTSYLIHYEIIMIMLKSRQEGLIDPNWSNALREFSAVFLISTTISYVIYILYEAPMNKLITLAVAGMSSEGGRKKPASNELSSGKQLDSGFACAPGATTAPTNHQPDSARAESELTQTSTPVNKYASKNGTPRTNIDYHRVDEKT